MTGSHEPRRSLAGDDGPQPVYVVDSITLGRLVAIEERLVALAERTADRIDSEAREREHGDHTLEQQLVGVETVLTRIVAKMDEWEKGYPRAPDLSARIAEIDASAAAAIKQAAVNAKKLDRATAYLMGAAAGGAVAGGGLVAGIAKVVGL